MRASGYSFLLILLPLLLLCAGARPVNAAGATVSTAHVLPLETLKGKKVAVTVFAQNAEAAAYARSAQTRLEEILADNDIKVLDEDKTRTLRDACTSLEDPSVFITPETFVRTATNFNIDGIVGVYLSVAAAPGLADYYSATAHADLRLIENTSARVYSFSAQPMGLPGTPPSDGLTFNSAAINAVQRAVDAACRLTGFSIAALARPGLVDITLVGPTPCSKDGSVFVAAENDRDLWSLAPLEKQAWRKETVTATTRAPAGGLAAVAGYTADTTSGGGGAMGGSGFGPRAMSRLYGSSVHLVDTVARTSTTTFVCSPLELPSRDEPNTKRVLFCSFIGSWRYLCAVTGNHLFLWDTERGLQLSKQALPGEPSGLAVQSDNTGSSVVIRTKRGSFKWSMARAGR
jgi:hypothetical protein